MPDGNLAIIDDYMIEMPETIMVILAFYNHE